MAEQDLRLLENAPGRFYVDSTCIDCDLCRQIAPDHFQRHDGIDFSVVVKQPLTDQELAAAIEAMESCPSNSIGDDGVAVEAAITRGVTGA